MAKNSVEAYGAKGKTNLLMFDPEDLLIVSDKLSPLYDERAALPVNDGLVRNIMHHGVLEPVLIARDPKTGKTAVAAGRQRVKACREANKRLKAQGCEPHRVPCIVKRGDDAGLMGVLISENEFRTDDTPLERARKAQRYIDLGRTEEEVGILLGMSRSTVANLLALLDSPRVVRDAIKAGTITAAAAYKLARMPEKEATAKIAALAKVTDPAEKRKKTREVVAGAPAVRGKREIAEVRKNIVGSKKLSPQEREAVLAVLDWVLGGDTLGELL